MKRMIVMMIYVSGYLFASDDTRMAERFSPFACDPKLLPQDTSHGVTKEFNELRLYVDMGMHLSNQDDRKQVLKKLSIKELTEALPYFAFRAHAFCFLREIFQKDPVNIQSDLRFFYDLVEGKAEQSIGIGAVSDRVRRQAEICKNNHSLDRNLWIISQQPLHRKGPEELFHYCDQGIQRVSSLIEEITREQAERSNSSASLSAGPIPPAQKRRRVVANTD